MYIYDIYNTRYAVFLDFYILDRRILVFLENLGQESCSFLKAA